MDCEQLQEVAAELAAGTLSGEERAAALAHVSACAACREDVAVLAGVVDGLLLLAPPAEPPAGFESRVLAALGTAPVVSAPRRLRPARWLAGLAAAAVVALVLGLAGGVALGRRDSARPPVVAALMARDGRDVGRAVLATGHPGWVVLDVAGLGGGRESYAIELDLGGGRSMRAGTVALVDGRGTARVKLSKAGVVGVHLVSLDGDYECEASFT